MNKKRKQELINSLDLSIGYIKDNMKYQDNVNVYDRHKKILKYIKDLQKDIREV
jgi:hypothetical protein